MSEGTVTVEYREAQSAEQLPQLPSGAFYANLRSVEKREFEFTPGEKSPRNVITFECVKGGEAGKCASLFAGFTTQSKPLAMVLNAIGKKNETGGYTGELDITKTVLIQVEQKVGKRGTPYANIIGVTEIPA